MIADFVRAGFGIEPQLGLARARIRAVAAIAFLGEDRADIAIEVRHIVGGVGSNGHDQQANRRYHKPWKFVRYGPM